MNTNNKINKTYDDEIIYLIQSILSNGNFEIETHNEAVLTKLMELRGTPIKVHKSLRDIEEIFKEWKNEIPVYQCDKCFKKHKLKQLDIIDKNVYIAPHGCSEGDYDTHDFYYFNCDCSRPIEVNEAHVNELTNPPIDNNSPNCDSGRCTLKFNENYNYGRSNNN